MPHDRCAAPLPTPTRWAWPVRRPVDRRAAAGEEASESVANEVGPDNGTCPPPSRVNVCANVDLRRTACRLGVSPSAAYCARFTTLSSSLWRSCRDASGKSAASNPAAASTYATSTTVSACRGSGQPPAQVVQRTGQHRCRRGRLGRAAERRRSRSPGVRPEGPCAAAPPGSPRACRRSATIAAQFGDPQILGVARRRTPAGRPDRQPGETRPPIVPHRPARATREHARRRRPPRPPGRPAHAEVTLDRTAAPQRAGHLGSGAGELLRIRGEHRVDVGRRAADVDHDQIDAEIVGEHLHAGQHQIGCRARGPGRRSAGRPAGPATSSSRR